MVFVLHGAICIAEVPKPSHLINQTQGFIILREYHEAKDPQNRMAFIKIISLPTLHEKLIQVPSKDIFALSGPNEKGQIAYVSGELFKNVELRLTTMEGVHHEIIFSQKGHEQDILSFKAPFTSLALSPKKGYLAIVRQLPPKSENDRFQIWDINQKRLIAEFDGHAAAWFPDGTKLAYTKSPPYKQGQHEPAKIFIYDLIKNKHTFFREGWNPIVSPDGLAILIEDSNPDAVMGDRRSYINHYWVNLETKEAKVIDLHQADVIAFTQPNIILCEGLVVSEKKPKTVVDSPLWGRKSLPSVLLVNLITNEFQTVIDFVHPYEPISYGRTISARKAQVEQNEN